MWGKTRRNARRSRGEITETAAAPAMASASPSWDSLEAASAMIAICLSG